MSIIYYNSSGQIFDLVRDTASYWQEPDGTWREGHMDGSIVTVLRPLWSYPPPPWYWQYFNSMNSATGNFWSVDEIAVVTGYSANDIQYSIDNYMGTVNIYDPSRKVTAEQITPFLGKARSFVEIIEALKVPYANVAAAIAAARKINYDNVMENKGPILDWTTQEVQDKLKAILG